MKKGIPEKCCANCKHLLAFPKNNNYNDVDYLCVKIGRYIFGRFTDMEKAEFYLGDGKTLDKSAASKCSFERKENRNDLSD